MPAAHGNNAQNKMGKEEIGLNNDGNDDGHGRRAKRRCARLEPDLRSMEPDLKVIVGGSNENAEGSKVFWHFSPTMASQSGYVDTFLSTFLPTNNKKNVSNEYMEITFDDITPSQWERMVRFIRDPLALQSMTVEDALELAHPYDQYDFRAGIELCDEVLSAKALFGAVPKDFEKMYTGNYRWCDSDEVDRCVNAIVLSNETNLKKTLHRGKVWLNYILDSSFLVRSRMPLKTNHIELLVPLIIRDSEIDLVFHHNRNSRVENDDDHDFDIKYSVVKGTIMKLLEIDDPVDFTSPLFPHLFLAKIQAHLGTLFASNVIRRIDVTFPTGEYIDGIRDTAIAFFLNNDESTVNSFAYSRYDSDSNQYHVLIKSEGDSLWQGGGNWIIKSNEDVVYVCQGSRLAILPPKTGWTLIDGNIAINFPDGQLPKLEYFLRNQNEDGNVIYRIDVRFPTGEYADQGDRHTAGPFFLNGANSRSDSLVYERRAAGSDLQVMAKSAGDGLWQSEGNWTIKSNGDTIYVCHGSRRAILPPKTGWTFIDAGIPFDFADGQLPKLEYFNRKESDEEDDDDGLWTAASDLNLGFLNESF